VSISVLYDSNIPEATVGEAVTYSFPELIKEVLGLKGGKLFKNTPATNRNGGIFYWEKASGKDFTIEYDSPGIHFESSSFSKYLLEEILVKYPCVTAVDEHITSISGRCINNTHNFDLLINCMGFPSKKDLEDTSRYSESRIETVNSVMLLQNPEKEDRSTNTYSYSTYCEHGWMFGVPLHHRKAYGYLYNHKLTSKEDVREDFKKVLHSLDIPFDPKKVKEISWKPYYKNTMIDDKTVYLGNQLYFVEPAQALALHFYWDQFKNNVLAKLLSPLLEDPKNDSKSIEDSINTEYLKEVYSTMDLVAFNYSGDVSTPSTFWDKTGAKCRKYLRGSEGFQKWLKEHEECGYCYPPLWEHDSFLMRSYFEGYGIDINKIRENK
jgi:hypothetical protein